MERENNGVEDQGICTDDSGESDGAHTSTDSADTDSAPVTEEEMEDDIASEEPRAMFNPPLYYQRYHAVQDVIRSHEEKGMIITKLMDVGCAECSFLQQAKKLPFFTELYGLDIDRELLQRKSGILKPLVTDYLEKRKRDLTISILCGSAAERDPSTKDLDVVTGIEVIEHLHDPVLDGLVETVFAFIRPKLVVLTTPNSEFNILFPNFSGMRHWDHKFEWTREQFQDWAGDISTKYRYTVSYSGVGDPPETHQHVGHCSQMAVFVRSEDEAPDFVSLQPNTEYDKIFTAVYPGHNMEETEMMDNEIIYTLNRYSFLYIAENDIEDLQNTNIPISDLLSNSDKITDFTVDSLADRLAELDYTLSADRQHVILDMEAPESSEYEGDSDWSDVDEEAEPVPVHGDDGYLSDGDKYREEEWG